MVDIAEHRNRSVTELIPIIERLLSEELLTRIDDPDRFHGELPIRRLKTKTRPESFE